MSRFKVAALALFAAASLVVLGHSPLAAAVSGNADFTVTGTILGADGTPVADQEVEIMDAGTDNYPYEEVSTGDDGTFTLHAPGDAGDVSVGFQYGPGADSYLAADGLTASAADAESITAVAGGNRALGDITLPDGGTIHGKLTTPGGCGEKFCYTTVTTFNADNGHLVTDCDGCASGRSTAMTYDLDRVLAGSYVLEIAHTSGYSSFADQFYPGVSDYADATPVSAASDQTTDASMTLSKGSTISGTLHDAKGHPLTGCRVQAFQPSGVEATRTGDVAGNGKFSITGVAPGNYLIAVNGAGYCAGPKLWFDGTKLVSSQSSAGTVTAPASGTVTLPAVKSANSYVPAWKGGPKVQGDATVGGYLYTDTRGLSCGGYGRHIATATTRWYVDGKASGKPQTSTGYFDAEFDPTKADKGHKVSAKVTVLVDGCSKSITATSKKVTIK